MAEEIIYKVQIEGTQENIKNLTFLQEAINELGRQKSALTKESKELAKALDEVNASNYETSKALKNVTSNYEEGTISQLEYEEAIKAINYTQEENALSLQQITERQYEVAESQVQLKLETKELNTEYRDQEKAIIDNAKANDAAENSIEQLRVSLRQAQQEYIKLSGAERENEEIGGALLASIQAQDEALKELESSIGINQRSVGDYGKAVEGTLPLLGGFGQQIQSVIGVLGQIKTSITGFATAQKGAAAATTATNGTLKAFRIALISTGIGAVVVVLGSLIAAFASTQRGIDAVNRVLAPLKELFQTFIGYLQNTAFKVFDGLKEAINNPKQAFMDLINFVKNTFISQFKGAVNLFISYGQLIVSSWRVIGLKFKEALSNVPILGGGIDTEQLKKDLKQAEKDVKQSAKNVANNAIQAATGIEGGVDKIRAAGKAASDAWDESNKRAERMHELQVAIETTEINLNKIRATNQAAIERQREITQDVSQSDEARLKAAKEAKKLIDEVTVVEQKYLDLKIEQTKISQEANDTDREGKKELADLEAERIKVEADAIRQKTRLSAAEFQINKQQQDRAIKAIEEEKKAAEKAAEDKAKTELQVANDLIDHKAKLLQLEFDLEQANTESTAEMKFNKEVDLLDKLNALRIEKAKLNNENLQEVELENQVKEAELRQAERERLAEEQAAADELELERLKEKGEREQEVKQAFLEAGFNAVESIASVQFANANRRRQQDVAREIEALNLKRQSGEISAEEFDKAREAIDRRAFERKKNQDTAQAIINGAVAVTKTFSSLGYPAGIVPAILAAGQTAAQVITIRSQKFAKGGFTGGGFGTPDSTGYKVAGVVHENEYVVPEKVLRSEQGGRLVGALERMRQNRPNVAALGFANGGPTGKINISNALEDIDSKIVSGVTSAISQIRVTNVSTETAETANRVSQIQENSTF